MGLKKQSREIKSLFTVLGYAPRQIFNALQGDRRLIFNDLENERRVDVFLDVFEMCHRFEFKDRLAIDRDTLSLADLLATKLQVVEITEREYRDIIALLLDHDVAETDKSDAINGDYLAKLAANDWGIYKTFSVNISNILTGIPQYAVGRASQEIVRKRLQVLQDRIEKEPKSMAWKLRARVGEKVRWYELPEQDKKIVDSRVGNKS